MSEENKRLLKRHFEELWNLGDLVVADEIFSANYTRHSGPSSGASGPESEKSLVVAWRTAFSGLTVSVEDLVAENDHAVARWNVRGIDTGGFMGNLPTGRVISVRGMKWVRFEGGKIIESWDSCDLLDLRQQLGADPVSATPV